MVALVWAVSMARLFTEQSRPWETGTRTRLGMLGLRGPLRTKQFIFWPPDIL